LIFDIEAFARNQGSFKPINSFGLKRRLPHCLSDNMKFKIGTSPPALQGERTVGWKIGCTSNAIQQQFGLTQPIWANSEASSTTVQNSQSASSLIAPST
jgi:hypothetical protein